MSFDIHQIRSVIRGEVSGSIRFLVLALGSAAVWVGAMWLSDLSGGMGSTATLQQERFATLSLLATEYTLLAPSATSRTNVEDAMTAFTQVSGLLELSVRLSRIVPTPDGRQCSVEINRIYAEELVEMVRELALRGMSILSAEIRALPAGNERLFSMNAVIGPETGTK